MSIPRVAGNSWTVNGQERVEGSDGSGNEPGEMEVGGGIYESWESVRNNKRKKKRKNKTDESDSDSGSNTEEKRREEYVIFAKLVDEGDSFGGMNPIQLTKSLNKEIGEIKSAKVLRNGALMIVCKDEKQQGKAIKMNIINGKKVECSKTYKKFTKGVITGILVNVSVDDVKRNITNARVNEVRRLKVNRNGNMQDSLSVMINFDQEKLPEKVYIGFMCYDVRLYIPPPIRCFKCQRYGHVAVVCKGKQRCGKCSGEHEYGKCQEGTKLKCCNCGGGTQFRLQRM
ncbi:Nucleic-acid-binding protein from transposon X-element [Labeo rohita]|uniref:Nucleic-acid-binding protein from transposon X-element n=1 Tax=Labeo rohita TaxID=84645 RepID=A0ABQ8MME7_LABRO|nr:Nucleic-acid-binding protein from transposon X-element [Labeo rohita]